MYGVINLIKNEEITKGSSILFIHAGGMTSIFQYDEILRKFFITLIRYVRNKFSRNINSAFLGMRLHTYYV
jgi:hypothetical protein